MDTNSTNTLQLVGTQLNQDIFPNVMNGGIVSVSCNPTPFLFNKDTEKSNGYSTRRSEARSRQRPPRREGPTRRSWPPGKTSQVICPSLQSKYQEDLANVHEAYPGTKTWQSSNGMWLLTESKLFDGDCKKAIFLTGLSFSLPLMVKSWGFWEGAIWIGPRHTNFPDGSICAFDLHDGTWNFGESLVPLLDLYTLWAVRHLHLQKFGCWPGRQTAFSSYERIIEFQDQEFCGCGSNVIYTKCCKGNDLKRDRIADAVEFSSLTGGGSRNPPTSITNFVRGSSILPPISIIQ